VPDKVAFVAGDTRLTYREFNEIVNRATNALATRDIAKGDRVALLSRNCLSYAVLAYALAKAGAVLVPINFMLSSSEVAFILKHADVCGFIVEDELTGVADRAIAETHVQLRLRALITERSASPLAWEDVSQWLEHPDPTEPDVVVDDDDVLRLMYTSGTESRPKGAMLTSRCLLANYVSCTVDAGMTGDDVDVHSMPFYHCAQLDAFLGTDVFLGATNVILRGPDPETVLRTLEGERATKFFAPPTVWIALLRCPAFDATDLSNLQKGYYGASAMPREVLRELQRRLPHLRLWNLYGQTEMAPLATALAPEEQMTRPTSAGRPVINVETKLVDDEGREAPAGTVGEIIHRSPQAMIGYWRDDARTAEAFRDGWFHSGDLGVMSEDGYLTVVDRKKDMINTGGENVSSREVEEAIYRLPGVAEVAVFAVPDPRWIEAVTAVVVPKPGVELSEADVIGHCHTQLSGFKVPKRVVIATGLPKNPSGKILKRELRVRYAELLA
jgi:fatty-acyl-CoA synthase